MKNLLFSQEYWRGGHLSFIYFQVKFMVHINRLVQIYCHHARMRQKEAGIFSYRKRKGMLIASFQRDRFIILHGGNVHVSPLCSKHGNESSYEVPMWGMKLNPSWNFSPVMLLPICRRFRIIFFVGCVQAFLYKLYKYWRFKEESKSGRGRWLGEKPNGKFLPLENDLMFRGV